MTIEEYVVNLNIVSHLADKAAKDVLKGRLWQGELDQVVAQMQKLLSEIPKERR